MTPACDGNGHCGQEQERGSSLDGTVPRATMGQNRRGRKEQLRECRVRVRMQMVVGRQGQSAAAEGMSANMTSGGGGWRRAVRGRV